MCVFVWVSESVCVCGGRGGVCLCVGGGGGVHLPVTSCSRPGDDPPVPYSVPLDN